MSIYSQKYFEELVNENASYGKKLHALNDYIKSKKEGVSEHHINLIYGLRLPADVSYLLFDLLREQIDNGKNCNVQRILQKLSLNDKKDYNKVYPLYVKEIERAKSTLVNGVFHTNTQTTNAVSVSSNNDVLPKENVDAKSFQNIINFESFKTTYGDFLVINRIRIPKQAWVLDIYADSQQDFIHIVQKTLDVFKSFKTTVFIAKPEVFEENLAKKGIAIAYRVIVSENFSFDCFNQEVLDIMDERNIVSTSPEGFLVAGRVLLTIEKFDSNAYISKDGLLVTDKKKILSSFNEANTVLSLIDKLNKNPNVVKTYIENMVSFPQSDTASQIYKAVVIDKEDAVKIASIISEQDIYNVDFVCETNISNKYILFIHISHLEEFVKKINECNLNVVINPKIDEKIF